MAAERSCHFLTLHSVYSTLHWTIDFPSKPNYNSKQYCWRAEGRPSVMLQRTTVPSSFLCMTLLSAPNPAEAQTSPSSCPLTLLRRSRPCSALCCPPQELAACTETLCCLHIKHPSQKILCEIRVKVESNMCKIREYMKSRPSSGASLPHPHLLKRLINKFIMWVFNGETQMTVKWKQ